MEQALFVVAVATAVLVWSANGMVRAAQDMAHQLGASPMLIGFTVVAFGTSAPELVVSVFAALSDNPGVAVGGGIGSNLVNTGVVLGLTLVSRPLLVDRKILWREFPLLGVATALVGYCFWDNHFATYEGVLLLVLLPLMLWLLVHWGSDVSSAPQKSDTRLSWTIAVFVVMLLLLLFSADQLVKAAIELAHHWGVSELLIGIILVALGTSLPELVVCIVALLRNSGAMALGSLLGSNIFNIFGVLGLAAALSSGYTNPELFVRVYVPLMAMTLLLFTPVLLNYGRGRDTNSLYLGRGLGFALLLAYCGCVVVWTVGDAGI